MSDSVSAPVVADEPGVWASIREALRGSHRDYTQGPIGRSIFILAVPMVLEMLMESIFAVVDVFFVAKLGPEAVATVGLTESMLAIVYTLAIGLSIGVAATVARRTGERDPDAAARTTVQGIALGLMVAAVIGAMGAVFAPDLLRLMGASDAVVERGANFTRVMLGGSASVLLLFLVNAAFRGAGDAAIAMRVLWFANAINIVLGPCFIFGLGPFPELGVTGAAIATTIGRSAGALFAISYLARSTSRIHVRRPHLQLDPALMGRLIRLSATGTFQVFIGMASWIGLVRIIASFGSDVLAGYTIGMRIIIFALLPAFGLSNAAATMVGQALGARNPERAERSVWRAGIYNACFLGAVSLVFVLFPRSVIGLFTSDPAVLPHGVDFLRTVSIGFIFYAFGMVLTQSFNGAGDTWTPTFINLFVFWIWEIPLAWVLSQQLGVGPEGVFIAILTAYSLLAVVSAVLFRRGQWKTKMV